MELALLEDRLEEGERLTLDAAGGSPCHSRESAHDDQIEPDHRTSGRLRIPLRGRFRVETNDRTLELDPGAPWSERDPDPVYAEVIGREPASFVRMMILPVTARAELDPLCESGRVHSRRRIRCSSTHRPSLEGANRSRVAMPGR